MAAPGESEPQNAHMVTGLSLEGGLSRDLAQLHVAAKAFGTFCNLSR